MFGFGVIVALAYYLGALFGLYLSFHPNNIASLWAPNGILLAALLLTSPRVWWVIFLAAFPAELAADLPLGVPFLNSLHFLLADFVEVLVAALGIRACTSLPLRFENLRETLVFMVWAVGVGPLVAAVIGAGLGGVSPTSMTYWIQWSQWVVGDAIAQLTLTPLVLLSVYRVMARRRGMLLPRLRKVEFVGTLLLFVALSTLVFSMDRQLFGNFPMLFCLPLPMLLWGAVRLGPLGTYAAGAVITCVALSVSAHGVGPFGSGAAVYRLVEVQSFLFVAIVPPVLLAALLEERRRANVTLRDSEAKYRMLVDHAADMVIRADMRGRILYASPSYCRVFGKMEQELADFNFMTLVHEEDREHTRKAMLELQRPPHTCYLEQRAMTKDGWQWIAWSDSAVFDDAGRIVEVIGVGRIITALKRAQKEHELLRERLARSRKMEALGLMAGGVAHDLNNILSGILSYPEFLLLDLPPGSKLRKPLETIRDSGLRAANVVQDMLSVARGAAVAKTQHELGALVREHLYSPEHRELMRQKPGVRLTVEQNAQEKLPISCSPVHVKKALMNLLGNAVEAVLEDGQVRVATRHMTVLSKLDRYEEIPPGEYAVLTVSDTGPGVSGADMDRLFEPFYTRKVMGRSGTGLGLTVVWNTLHDHNGFVDLVSSGKGTTFELFFPVDHTKPVKSRPSVAPVAAEGQGQLLLVVDDEPAQREIATKILNRLSYTAEAVGSGPEALEYIKKKPVDLILLDMVMPGMDGKQTYEEIVKIAPGQKVIIVSGFAEPDVAAEMQAAATLPFIQKPYGIKSLAAIVKSTLS